MRVPKMKELRDGTIKGFQSEKAHIVEQIAFKNKMRERQRQAKLVLINKEKEEIMKARKLLKKKKPMNELEKVQQMKEDAMKGKYTKKRKKMSKTSKYWNEKALTWDDVTEEERLAKRLKRGKITQEEFDNATAALDKRAMTKASGARGVGVTRNKHRMVPEMMKEAEEMETKRRRRIHVHSDMESGDEEEIEHAKEVLRQHTERVVAAKRKHRFATRSIK